MTETRTLQFESARARAVALRERSQTVQNARGFARRESHDPRRLGETGRRAGAGGQARSAFSSNWSKPGRKGVDIQKHEFNYALNSVNEARADNLERRGRRQDHHFVAQTADCRAHARAAQLCRGDSETRRRLRDRPGRHRETYLAVAMAVAALKKEQVSRIILTRPAVEAGEALGFLPGDLQEKITPYLRPLYDALHDMLEPEEIERSWRARRSRSRRSPTCAAAP